MRNSVASYYLALWVRSAALASLAASIFALFVLSGSVLDSLGYRYDVEGGSFIDKVHPATFLVILSLGLRLASEADPIDAIKRIFLSDGALLVALAAFVIIEIYTASALQVPITPPVDTYLLPVLDCFALRGLNKQAMRMLAIMILLLFTANALAAIYERLAGTRLFFVIPDDITGHPEDPTTKFDWKGHLAWDWRSTAMLGHPLENAMMTGCLMLLLQSEGCRWIPLGLRAGMFSLQAVAMLTFGGRVALVLTPVVSAIWWIARGLRGLSRGHRLNYRYLAITCCAIPIVAIVSAGFYQSGLLDKLIERFADDSGSAQTRLTMWRLFTPIPWGDVFLGPNPDVVATHVKLEGLELGIESFWAGLPLTYGIVMAAILLTSWCALSLYLARKTCWDALFVIAFYFGVASTSAGLASKTTSVGFFVVLILVLLRKPAADLVSVKQRASAFGRIKTFPFFRAAAPARRAYPAEVPGAAMTTAGTVGEKRGETGRGPASAGA